MPIDFFADICKSSSKKQEFGLCDDPHPATNPAYIDEDDNEKWIAIAINPQKKFVEFYAIDHCIEILREDGKMESRCDGFLYFNNNIIFVELKSRKKSGSAWLKDGVEQIKKTIDKFKTNHKIKSFNKVEAYVCNQLKPLANQGHAAQLEKFKNETGIILKAQQNILV